MRTKTTVYVIFALLLSSSWIMSSKAQGDITAGKKLIETGQWNKAHQFFLEQVSKNPGNAEVRFYLAETYFAFNKVDSAESNYAKGEIANGDFPFNTAGLGRVILVKGDTLKAKELFNKAIKSNKKNMDLYAYIAQSANSANQQKIAAQYIARAKEISTKNANLHMADGDLWRLKGNAGEAANAYERAFYYDKNCILAYIKLGVIFTEARNYDIALENFNKALAIDPQYTLAFKGLGDMYYKKGDFKAASENYKKYLGLAEENLEDTYRYAFILFYNKEFADATKILQDLLTKDPQNPVLLRLQSYISYELGMEKGKVTNPESIKKALETINKFLAVQNKSKYLSSDFEYLAKIQQASGLDSLAPGNFLKAYELDSTNTSFIEDAAKAYMKTGDYDNAALSYQKLLKVSSENPSVNYWQMGRMYYLAARKDTAKADSLIVKEKLLLADSAFMKVSELSPNSYLGPFWMARTETMLDVKQEGLANASYEKVIQVITTANDQAKRKNELMEAFNYFASFYYVQAYNAKAVKKDNTAYQDYKTKSMDFWNKMLELSPNDQKATEGIKAVNELSKIK